MRRPSSTVLPAATLLLGACLAGAPTSKPPVSDDTTPATTLSAAGPLNTFNHDLDERDPFDILQQQMQEGSPEVATRLHSCRKISYGTLGQLLTSRGVKLDAVAASGMPPTAGELYMGGGPALGAPNYAARTAEPIELTTAAATKLFDVFVQAAPEIIAAMPSLPACSVGGQGAQMFDGTNNDRCTLDGISCLLGAPATQEHVDLCNMLVASASSTEVGRSMAVASLMAAAHTCE